MSGSKGMGTWPGVESSKKQIRSFSIIAIGIELSMKLIYIELTFKGTITPVFPTIRQLRYVSTPYVRLTVLFFD